MENILGLIFALSSAVGCCKNQAWQALFSHEICNCSENEQDYVVQKSSKNVRISLRCVLGKNKSEDASNSNSSKNKEPEVKEEAPKTDVGAKEETPSEKKE